MKNGNSMDGTRLDFFVAHIMHGKDADAMRVAGLSSTSSEAAAQWACNELVWPAMETVQDLFAAGLISRPRLNSALLLLDKVVGRAVSRIAPAEPLGRSAMIFTVPGEREEFGAAMLSRLAEQHGWNVYFAGAGLTHEDVMFAIGRLVPDVLVIHAGLWQSKGAVVELLKKLQHVGVWPATQITVCGRTIEELRNTPGIQADLLARTPVELLELMQLCPDYRATPGSRWLGDMFERAEGPPDQAPGLPGDGEFVPEPIRRRIAGGLGSPDWN